MRIFSLLIFALTGFWPAVALAQGSPTLWEHNGSQMHLFSNGAQRQFYYQAPAANLGVPAGTLLFNGRRNGTQYSGTSYVFSKSCGALKYAVAGAVSADQRTVTMYGKAPVVDSSCRVVGYRDDVLVFNLLPSVGVSGESQATGQTQAINQSVADSEYAKFEEQWKICFGIERPDQTDAFRIRACDVALSYPRITNQDRGRLIERQTVLKQPQQAESKSADWREPISNRPYTNLNIPKSESARDQSLVDTPFLPSARVSEPPRGSLTPVKAPQYGDIDAKPLFKIPSELVPGLLAIGGFLAILIILAMIARRLPEPVSSAAGPEHSIHSAVEDATASETQPSTYISNEPPSQSMSLKLKRSQRPGMMGKVIFILDARIGLTAEEHALIRKYRLGGNIIYDSSAREKYAEATRAQLETLRESVPISAGVTAQLIGLGKVLYRGSRVAGSAAMAALSLRVTIDKLIQGVHVECKSMDELLAAENAIREAAANLKAYLDTAATFDGREEVIEL